MANYREKQKVRIKSERECSNLGVKNKLLVYSIKRMIMLLSKAQYKTMKKNSY